MAASTISGGERGRGGRVTSTCLEKTTTYNVEASRSYEPNGFRTADDTVRVTLLRYTQPRSARKMKKTEVEKEKYRRKEHNKSFGLKPHHRHGHAA